MSRGTSYKYEDYHKIINDILYKKCSYHFELFPDEDFWFPATTEYYYKNDKNSKDGLASECKKCTKKKVAIWQKDNPETYKEHRKKIRDNPKVKDDTRRHNKDRRDNGKYYEWMANNPDKALKYMKDRQHKNHRITKKEWKECKSYFNNQCAYCGFPEKDHYRMYRGELRKEDLHKEHVDHEGSNDLSNCVPACQSCNDQKWKFHLDYWYNEENTNYIKERYDKIIKWIEEDHEQYIQPIKPKRKYVKKNRK